MTQNEQILTQRRQQLEDSVFTALLPGIAKNIRVTTVGGVLRAGEELMQIVPVEDDLIIEAKVSPADIALVRTGQQATIRFDPFDYTIYGSVPGEVVYVSPDAPAVWFAYSPNRKGEHPARHLQTFEGILQADAYAGFGKLYDSGRVISAACWANVMRKFYEIAEAHDSPLAQKALQRIGALYAIEAEIRGQLPALRQARASTRRRR